MRDGESPGTVAEILTRQFYDWERRGRGWRVWDWPVKLEPPFRPFLLHFSPAIAATDDARKPTLLSILADSLLGRSQPGHGGEAGEELVLDAEPEEPQAKIDSDETPLSELAISLPTAMALPGDRAEQFLMSLSGCAHPVSYEIIGLRGIIAVHLVCRRTDSQQVCQQFRAHFPDAVITEQDEFLAGHWDMSGDRSSVVVEFGLSQEFMRPIKRLASFTSDPLIPVTGALADVGKEEVALVQVLFRLAENQWGESARRAVTGNLGGAFFADAPEMAAMAREKTSRPLFAAVLRIATQSRDHDRAWELARMLRGSLTQFADPGSNELMPLSNEDYDDVQHRFDVLSRQTCRSGMLLNSSELASLVHLPADSVRSENLKRERRRTKPAPAVVLGQGIVLGENIHAGRTQKVALSRDLRLRHTHIIGASGTGKSTLLLNMLIQDIHSGEGVGVLDPHGDLIDAIFGFIPEERFEDVVLLDPADEEYPVGFNILSAHSEKEKILLASDLVAVFRRLSTSWGDQMTSVLGNAILAFLESREGGTLAELRRFLVEKQFRERFLATVSDPEIIYYWQREFPLLTGRPQAPILTRLDTFLRPKLIRNMVVQKENRIDFREIMDEGRIFLVRLSQGAIGAENAHLLGSMLVSGLHQAAMSRQELEESARRDFFLYLDEFQNFATPSMAAILTGTRKYRLALVLAHHELRQLTSRSEDVASGVLTNPATRICFLVGDQDAKRLESGFASFEASDFLSLGVGEAICRVERSDWDFNLKTAHPPETDADAAVQRKRRITALSRSMYATKREHVEEEPPSLSVIALAELPKGDSVQRKPQPRRAESISESGKIHRSSAEVQPRVMPLKTSDTAPASGRGGQQHKYLQQLIKRWAESRGFRATIEKLVLDGTGSVDIALEKEHLSVACEICVSTTPGHEVANIQKCLSAGFEFVAMVATDRKKLREIEKAAAGLETGEQERLRCFLPEELFAFLEEQKMASSIERNTVRGYKVKVTLKHIDNEERRTRKKAIAGTILDAVRRMREK